jgi:hypothetical protein
MNLHKTGPLSIHSHFSAVRLVLARPRNSFGPTESSSRDDYFHNNTCEGLHNLFLRANRDIFVWQHMTCLGRPRNYSTPREGSRRHFLQANPDVFAWQHVNSYGPPKESTKLPARFICPLLIDLHSPTHIFRNA